MCRTDLPNGECCNALINKMSEKLATARLGAPIENIHQNVSYAECPSPSPLGLRSCVHSRAGRRQEAISPPRSIFEARCNFIHRLSLAVASARLGAIVKNAKTSVRNGLTVFPDVIVVQFTEIPLVPIQLFYECGWFLAVLVQKPRGPPLVSGVIGFVPIRRAVGLTAKCEAMVHQTISEPLCQTAIVPTTTRA